MADTKRCYIRRTNSPWVEGKPHHYAALQSYMSYCSENIQPGARRQRAVICTDHEQGGQFIANFSQINESLYQFIDEYGNAVDIMMEEPEKIAFINRISN